MNKNKTFEVEAYRKNGIKRLVLVGLSLVIELLFIVLLINKFYSTYSWIEVIMRILIIFFVLYIYSLPKTSTMKMPWIILMLSMPVFGVVLYLLVGLSGSTRSKRERFNMLDKAIMPNLPDHSEVLKEIKNKDVVNICKYINNYSSYPAYDNSDVKYFADTNAALKEQLKQMKKAKKFIFLEYHAIEPKIAWKQIQDVLVDRAKHGVEVRIFYDDLGSIGFINYNFVDEMKSLGLKCKVFNIFKFGLKFFLNNRDHRKMTIIDGQVGFVGGYNLADEYFNITRPYGAWKDAGIKIEGEAVKNLTASFLEMWNGENNRNEILDDFATYFPNVDYVSKEKSFVQPYSDSPMNPETLGENVYMDIINYAHDYVYFMTPYLIITDEMAKALVLAAKRGVDVRIITPGVPDKKLTYSLTRSYYHALVKAGVKIYEWTPGFLHAKVCISDDDIATVGSINLDYRSLYHHFENGCLIHSSKSINDIKKDFNKTFKQSENVSQKYLTGRTAVLRFSQLLLRMVAELI